MKKVTKVFLVVIVLAVALITPAQAHEEDTETPDNVCPAYAIEGRDAPLQFKTWEFHEVLPEDPEHSLIHEALDISVGLQGELCQRGFCMIGANTGGPGYCHDSIAYPCRECVRWETSGIEPVCADWKEKICVHRGHCNSWEWIPDATLRGE